jgi:hypothetical protein
MAKISENKFKIFGFFLLTFMLILNLLTIYNKIKNERVPDEALYYEGTIFEVSNKYYRPFLAFYVALQFFVCLLGFYTFKKVSKLY